MNSISGLSMRSQAMPSRREMRIAAALSLMVLGIDADGKVFHEPAVTTDISFSGAQIAGVRVRLNRGDIIGVQRSGDKGRFEVSWIEGSGEGGTSRIGLRSVEKGKSPWLDRLQHLSTGAVRAYGRHPCNGSVSLRSAKLTTPIWGSLRDVSEGGCYVQCGTVVPVGEIVSGQFIVDGVQINGVAEVCTTIATVGMGLLWCDLGRDGQEKLNSILQSFSLKSGDASSHRLKALAQIEKVHQMAAGLREYLERNSTLVDVQMIGRLSDAEEKLAAALKSVRN